MSTSKRINRTDGEWEELIKEFNASGLTQGVFCEQRGVANRFNGDTNMRISTWLYNGASTIKVGLTDGVYTSIDGYQFSGGSGDLNEAGQMTGFSRRFNGSTRIADMTSGQVAYLLTPTAVPVPPAVWLFGSGLLGLIGIAKKK